MPTTIREQSADRIGENLRVRENLIEQQVPADGYLRPQKTILVVDDEVDIIDLLRYNLEKEGFKVLSALDGSAALQTMKRRPDLVLLDVMMPGMDGWEVCRRIKRDPNTASTPILFLTAKGSEVDEVIGLELGGDDYIVKPIRIGKLLARIKSTLRRYDPELSGNEKDSGLVRIDKLEINIPNYTVKIGTNELPFTKKEFETLSYLARHPERVITRERLLGAVWGHEVHVVERTVDVHISKVREKLGQYGDLIETVKGVGYRFKGQPE
jgi:DNA-binding response OmpR family regulator